MKRFRRTNAELEKKDATALKKQGNGQRHESTAGIWSQRKAASVSSKAETMPRIGRWHAETSWKAKVHVATKGDSSSLHLGKRQ